jgi:hypothetical protein
MVDDVDRCEIAGVERVVPFRHEREQVCGAGGTVSHGRHEASFYFMRDDDGLDDHIGVSHRASNVGEKTAA